LFHGWNSCLPSYMPYPVDRRRFLRFRRHLQSRQATTMKAVAMMQANTTSQMIVEWPRDADLFWFWRLKGEASEVCGGDSMVFTAL